MEVILTNLIAQMKNFTVRVVNVFAYEILEQHVNPLSKLLYCQEKCIASYAQLTINRSDSFKKCVVVETLWNILGIWKIFQSFFKYN